VWWGIPIIWADFLGDQLRRDFGEKEGEIKDSLTVIVIVGGQSVIREEVI
jgi:hypothetical protein